jgi:CubicO group peptidase (beta-lactamase class C family)
MFKKLAFVVLTPHGRRSQRMCAGSAVRLVSAVLLVSLAGWSGRTGHAAGDPASSEPPAAYQPYQYQVPRTLDDGWTTASLDSVGMDRRHIEQLTEAIRRYSDWNIHAVLIERDGRLVYEEYFAGEDQRWGRPLGRVPFDAQTRHDLRSISKSVVSALVGIAMASGGIRSLDEPLLGFFPEPAYADLATPAWRSLTLRHALTMSAGLEWNEDLPYTDPRNDEIVMSRSSDPIRYVLSRPIVGEPGATWTYNGGLTQLLGVIVQRATGQPLREYARATLFEPLGVDDIEWLGDLNGAPSAASGLRLRPRDLAKFGSLYLHDGQWRSRQIIPPDWVRESTRRHLPVRNPVSAFGTHGYGYQWWHNCYRTGSGTFESHTAAGNGQQRIYVLPALRLVVTVLAGRYNDPSAAWLTERLLLEHIIPAVRMASHTRPGAEPAGCYVIGQHVGR